MLRNKLISKKNDIFPVTEAIDIWPLLLFFFHKIEF